MRITRFFGGRDDTSPLLVPTHRQLHLMATLLPTLPHFSQFARDQRLSGIRLNSATVSNFGLDDELARMRSMPVDIPLYFDVKGRQLRVVSVDDNPPHYMDLILNHPIRVDVPTVVLFKAGADHAELTEVCDGGFRLRFAKGARYHVHEGESLHIRNKSLQVLGPTFVPTEMDKIAKVRVAGFTKYFLSYVESQRDVDEFLELVGRDAQVMLKIENCAGLQFVAREFTKRDNLTLVAARGDLYVELDRPHEIMHALRLIITADPHACVGSRLLLSMVAGPVPSCADLCELAWLYDIGYRCMMLCDELCLKGELLAAAVNVFDAFRQEYTHA